jgi:hypothetical protein
MPEAVLRCSVRSARCRPKCCSTTSTVSGAVEDLQPDLLRVELEPTAWEQGELAAAWLEVREALLLRADWTR